MGEYRVISSDDHLFEAPDLWTSRLGHKYGDRVPRIVRLESGGEWWVTDGMKGQPIAAATMTGVRFDPSLALSLNASSEQVRPGAFDPDEHLKDMDMDGVYASVLYPNAGFMIFSVPDTELLNAVFSTYNDWVAEHCQTHPDRLKGLGMINLDDIQWGIRELKRCHKLGLVGALISVAPPAGRGYDQPEYEPFWAAANDLEFPLSLHTGTQRSFNALVDAESFPPEAVTVKDAAPRVAISQMIMSGVFERHPKLQVGAVEFEIAWAAHFVDRMDYAYTQPARRKHWHRYKEDMLPSDYFRRNVFLGFQEDELGIRLRDVIGVETLQWGSDYPHQESTFPRSREILEEILTDCTEDEREKISGGNAARIYHID
jgi:predicted TIM-barrel fold metal-dependent hydrolase